MSTTGITAAPVTAKRSELEIELGSPWVVEDRLIDRRRSGQHGDPLCVDRARGTPGFLTSARVADTSMPRVLQVGECRLVPEVVEEGVDDEVPVRAGDSG